MNREIVQNGDLRLKAPNQQIDDFNNPKLKQVIQDLIDSMRFNGLVGIAAPQIGENLKIFITEPRETKTRTGDQTDELRVYINPKITSFSTQKSLIWEGCGSYKQATFFGPVIRSKEITVEASDLNGQRFSLTCDGLLARVIQHEYDHLNGIEFVDRMNSLDDLKTADYYLNEIRNKPELAPVLIINKKILGII